MVGISPGIINTYSLKASPFVEKKIEISPQETVKSVGKAEEGVQEKVLTEKELEAEKEKAMSSAEEIAWLIGKTFLPTLAVMAFSAAVACPLAWVVVGSVLVGAATAGLVTYGYEKRKNSFRNPENKKSMDKIMRDVTIAAAINGAMAPFNMLTAGIAQAVGPVTAKTILKTAAKSGLVYFGGRTVANTAKAAVTNLWYDHYYNYDEREKILNSRIETLTRLKKRTKEQDQLLADHIKELDDITKEKYTWENFKKDERSALIWAGVSGILGGAAGKMAGQMGWAKKASSKIFGSTEHANTVANAVVSNPFAFATGAATAAASKRDMLNQIKMIRLKQSKYEEGSAPWKYYEEKVAELEKTYTNTSLVSEGKKAMLSNAASQVAVVGISAVKTRCFDLPSQKRLKVQQKYEERDPNWQKANELKQKLETLKTQKPLKTDYSNRNDYLQAVRKYGQDYKSLHTQYNQAKVMAASAQNTAENKQVLKNITKEVNAEFKFNQKAELAKSLGQESYVKFKIDTYKDKSEYAGLTDSQLREKAITEVRSEYSSAARTNATNLANMKSKLEQNKQGGLSGKIVTKDGKRYVQVTREDGTVALEKPFAGKADSWWQNLTTKDPAKMTQAEINSAIKQVYNSGAMVKPSTFRNEFVDMRVNQLRAQGMTDKQIESQLSGIVKEANTSMSQTFGGSWQNIVKSEVLAEALSRAKYDAGKTPGLKSILNFVKTDLPATTITSFQRRLKADVASNLPGVLVDDHFIHDPQRDEVVIDREVDRFLRGN
jgi:hypothetical protein